MYSFNGCSYSLPGGIISTQRCPKTWFHSLRLCMAHCVRVHILVRMIASVYIWSYEWLRPCTSDRTNDCVRVHLIVQMIASVYIWSYEWLRPCASNRTNDYVRVHLIVRMIASVYIWSYEWLRPCARILVKMYREQRNIQNWLISYQFIWDSSLRRCIINQGLQYDIAVRLL